jgi:hypothetical protein
MQVIIVAAPEGAPPKILQPRPNKTCFRLPEQVSSELQRLFAAPGEQLADALARSKNTASSLAQQVWTLQGGSLRCDNLGPDGQYDRVLRAVWGVMACVVLGRSCRGAKYMANATGNLGAFLEQGQLNIFCSQDSASNEAKPFHDTLRCCVDWLVAHSAPRRS